MRWMAAALLLAACGPAATPDAGRSDGGTSDSGTSDSGTGEDAALDASSALDASVRACAVPPGADERVGAAVPADGWRCIRDPRPLSAPRDVLVTRSGDVLITESRTGRIVQMGPSLEVVAEGLTSPIGLREMADGRLLVAQENRGTLSAVDRSTGVVSVLATGLPAVTYLTLGPDGAAYVSSFREVAETGTGVVFRVDLESGTYVPFATSLHVPEGLFFEGVDPASARLRVVEWLLPTTVREYPAGGGAASVVLSDGYDHAYGLVSDGEGGHIVADHAGRIVRVRADGTREVLLEGIGRPGGLARTADGAILIAEFVDFSATGYLIRLERL